MKYHTHQLRWVIVTSLPWVVTSFPLELISPSNHNYLFQHRNQLISLSPHKTHASIPLSVEYDSVTMQTDTWLLLIMDLQPLLSDPSICLSGMYTTAPRKNETQPSLPRFVKLKTFKFQHVESNCTKRGRFRRFDTTIWECKHANVLQILI